MKPYAWGLECVRFVNENPPMSQKNDASAKFSASRALTAAWLRCRADRRRTGSYLIVCLSAPSSGNAYEVLLSWHAVRTEREVHQAMTTLEFVSLTRSCFGRFVPIVIQNILQMIQTLHRVYYAQLKREGDPYAVR